MPLHRKEGPDGQYWVRSRFNATDYTVPEEELRYLLNWKNDDYPTEELLIQRDGPFVNWEQLARFTRDGKQWVLLRRLSHDYCVEVQIASRGLGEVVAVPPQRAWDLALERDKRIKVVYESA